MSVQLAPAIGFAVLSLTSGLAVYYWRRSAGLYALLVEGANRFEELRARANVVETALAAAEGKFKQHRESTQRLTQGLEEARDKSAELTKRLEQKEHEARVVSEKLELQKGHLERQLAKVQELLRLTEEQRQTEANRWEQERAANAQELDLKEKELQLKVREAGAGLAAAEKKAKVEGPLEIRKLKRKIAQYDRLYSSMKGLREMTEERNRNWEVALRKLSAWVLTESGRAKAAVPEAIGPLVGQAMQAIGAQLIDDHADHPDHSFGGRGGAEFTAGMDGEDLELEAALREADDLQETGSEPRAMGDRTAGPGKQDGGA